MQNDARGRGAAQPTLDSGVVYVGAPRALARELERRLGAGSLEAAPERVERRIELDTIELGLERAGERLTWEGGPTGGGVLEWRGADGRQARLELEQPPEFATDLEPGPLRSALDKAAGLRRLLALREVERSERELRRLDARGKTVARVVQRSERFRPPGTSAEWAADRAELVIAPVRGFEAQHAELVAVLGGVRGLAPRNGEAPAARPAPGRPFAFDPPEAWPALERSQPAARALRAIVLRQLEIVQAQEPGLRADLDTEFLHDLRVAVRRARAMLSQLSGALHPREAELLRKQITWLGRLAGPLRDLDVMLLELRLLEPELREPLQPLTELLEQQRERERKAWIDALDSPRWVEVQALWQGWAEGPALGGAPSLGELLAERIERLRRRVRREGAQLGAQAAPSALHALRIECKKLRYLLECASRSMGTDQPARCVIVLRGLQEVLGLVNDARLQAERLESWAKPLAKRGPRALLALGRWIERRAAAERRARARFAERFEGFDARGAREDFAALCGALSFDRSAP